jgi:uncharacterized protein (UPF0276 family)
LNPLLARSGAAVDWLEVTPEHFMPFGEDGAARLAQLARRFPLVGHSLELSLGSDGEDMPGYREAIGAVLDAGKALWHSDHLCFTRVASTPVHALTPLPFTDAAVETVARNTQAVARELHAPFLLENIAYYFGNPTSAMGEAEFINKVLLATDAGLLLDLHNVFTNAVNFHFDPYRFLDALPLERVVQIHIAGGEEIEGIWFDTHASLCHEEVWSLLDYVAPRCPVRGVNFEMDGRFPPWEIMLSELARARAVLERHGIQRAS